MDSKKVKIFEIDLKYRLRGGVPRVYTRDSLVEIVITQRTILTPVTIQKDYVNFRAQPTNPEKQSFARQFGQGHKTPAAERETARKKKQKEPNAKKKLIMLDGQKKIFEYTSAPAVSPSIVDPASDPYAAWRWVSPIYSISSKLPNPSTFSTGTVSYPSPAVNVTAPINNSCSVTSSPLASGSSRSSLQTPSTVSSLDSSWSSGP